MLIRFDAAICVSAQASDKEKDAAYRFLSYLADPENAQIFCDMTVHHPVSQVLQAMMME